MDVIKFTKLFDETVEKCRSLTISKNKEYARGGDKLHNFKRAAAAKRINPERALDGMMLKHTTSIDDYLDDLDKGIDHSLQKWDEKIIDKINYLILLRALLYERYQDPLVTAADDDEILYDTAIDGSCCMPCC